MINNVHTHPLVEIFQKNKHKRYLQCADVHLKSCMNSMPKTPQKEDVTANIKYSSNEHVMQSTALVSIFNLSLH